MLSAAQSSKGNAAKAGIKAGGGLAVALGAVLCRADRTCAGFNRSERVRADALAADTVIYTSSFFGDELWPADKLSFTNNAVTNCPSPVTFIYVQGENTSVNVKRLPKRPGERHMSLPWQRDSCYCRYT